MLAPDQRSSYTDALRPPPGWHFDYAVAATYSLDLTTLLAFPLQLALDLTDRDGEAVLHDGVVLLEALRRTTDRLAVFCQQGQIHAPRVGHMLYCLLEPVVHEVRAPHSGVFHAKFWLMRFVSGSDSMLRLVMPTRNITTDRCWDLVLSLEGRPGPRAIGANRPLRDLVTTLPALAKRAIPVATSDRVNAIADEAHRATWDLPSAFEEVRFHAPGLKLKRWLPPESNRLAVISPFVADAALQSLAQTTYDAVALISRPEALATMPSATLEMFEQLRILHETTLPDDADEAPRFGPPNVGLHAKAYILEKGWDTHVIVGSANATNAALSGRNVEILAELVGRRSQVGSIDEMLGTDAMGAVLTHFDPPSEPVTIAPALMDALESLRAAQTALMSSDLRIECTAADDNTWVMALTPDAAVALPGIESLRFWPVSMRESTAAVDGIGLREGATVSWPPASVLSVTEFIAFELIAAAAAESSRFVLRLPASGIPTSERDSAVIRSVIANRDGFLRYLLLLLGEEDLFFGGLTPTADGVTPNGAFGVWHDAMPLLEEMTRALHRDPSRLLAIRKLMKQLGEGASQSDDLVPPEFLQLWLVFEEVLGEVAS